MRRWLDRPVLPRKREVPPPRALGARIVAGRLTAQVCTLALVLTGCAGVPNGSAPQAIGTVERPAPANLPKPTPGMDPDVLLREFLKATADPANRHLAARQFLTQSASNAWDDAGSALLIDHVVFVETHSAERVSVSMRAETLGSLSDMGVFETAEGQLPDSGPIELVKTPGGWRIDKLPDGVFLDWQQFQATYKRNTLYFSDPTGKTMVPDPRYVAVSDRDQLATELVSKLIAGPRPEMAKSVHNMLTPPVRLRGPVTRADGGKTGVGRGYGGARIDLELLTVADPRSKQLVAAQIIWTLARADLKGPYVIKADGASLDERFADGWNTTDVAATDPGVAEGAAAGVHALIGGQVVALDGQRSDPVPGAFGRTTDQTSAALSRNGHQVASIVTLRPGAPDMASSLWIGDLGGEAAEAADGHTLSRPTWSLDDAVWVVADGSTVLRAIQETASGQPARLPVDSAGVSSRFPGVIADLQLSRDGTRAAMIINGQVVCSSVEQTQAGQFALTYPRRLGFGLGSSVVSLSWRTDEDIAVSRNDAEHPVSYVNIDGVNSDAPSANLQQPVGVIAANPSTVYVADPRGVMQLSISGAEGVQGWLDVPPFMAGGAMPVMPG
ncbi:MtrAB system accessory lipoprotein LpqB [Mycobacterium sp.]|uniref:MtrAB system accessory lipoprotein LpqB n=1 Tax=Mycobacterium sp. TaxID=1785 RepID=UPI003D0A63D9